VLRLPYIAHYHASSGASSFDNYMLHVSNAGVTTANLELALVLSNVFPHLFLHLLCTIYSLAEGFS